MATRWLREEQPDLAVERILDAADKVFAAQGVSSAGMAEIAIEAGCSRGTLYRYFKNRHELHVGYVNREARSIVERLQSEVAQIQDPTQRAVEYTLGAVREVRGNPGTAAWFEPGMSGMSGVSGLAARMSRTSEVIETFTTAFVSDLLTPRPGDPEVRLRARWFVRIVVSLLADPGESEAEERALVERFVAPALQRD
jgi:AcrR family transcriptional regulator